MSELVPLLETLVEDAAAGRPCALCVVVGKKGSAPQAPGASLLLRADFSTLGTLGGGCVEAELCRRARANLATGESSLVDFVLDHDYGWDDGLICGGAMQIAVMPVTKNTPLEPYRAAIAAAREGRAAKAPLRVEHEGKTIGWNVTLETSPRAVIAGGGHVGHALARLLLEVDFRVTVLDDRPEFVTAARFPDPIERMHEDIAGSLARMPLAPEDYVVIVTRGHQHDHEALAAVVNRGLRYVGLIGSKRKTRMIFEDLKAAGVSEEALARVHSPIGLAIGAVLVPEISVSIAAEMIQERRRDAHKLIEGPFAIEADV